MLAEMTPPIPPEASKEIEKVKSLVAKHFPVYDVRVSYDVVEFFVRIDKATLEDTFEKMREDMSGQGYIPMILYDKGEHIVTVARKPPQKFRSFYVNLAMLAVTLVTTIIAGAFYWAGYGTDSEELITAETLSMGFLTFALPLLGILGIHELGHYFMARHRKVAASLPFFIPFIPPLGTLGAFISLRDPIPNKKRLIEIGVAGPIAGFLLTIPIAILGLILTNDVAKPVPDNVDPSGMIGVGFPLIYMWIAELVPATGDYLLHPTAFAAWVGFLVTAINLLPAGQLDGGHIARALLGSRAKYLSWAVVGVLVALSYWYTGWILFALFVLFVGVRHPPPLNDISELDWKRKGLGAFAIVMLVIAFVPQPLSPISADYSFELEPLADTNATISAGASMVFPVDVNNTGNALNEIRFVTESGTSELTVKYKSHSEEDSAYVSSYRMFLNSSEASTLDLMVMVAASAVPGDVDRVVVKAVSANTSIERRVELNITVGNPIVTFQHDTEMFVPIGDQANSTVEVENLGDSSVSLTMQVVSSYSWVVAVVYAAPTEYQNATDWLNLTVPAQGSVNFTLTVLALDPAYSNVYDVTIGVYYNEDGNLVFLQNLAIEVTVG
ncbi:MAG: site-2 protease family protein [Thermoplasmata archaeon]|nr:site-2 protease family protein [Thermoplasmata archaeon]